MNETESILDEIDGLLERAPSVPFMTHKKIIDGERLLELIDSLRSTQPSQIREAKKIIEDKERIINEADARAANIIKKAEQRRDELVARETIVAETKVKVKEMIKLGQSKSEAFQKAAAASVSKMYNEAERVYRMNLKEIETFKSRLSQYETGLERKALTDSNKDRTVER